MTCSTCATPNETGARFCKACGHRLHAPAANSASKDFTWVAFYFGWEALTMIFYLVFYRLLARQVSYNTSRMVYHVMGVMSILILTALAISIRHRVLKLIIILTVALHVVSLVFNW